MNAASPGIRVFLLFEILAHATDPVEHALEKASESEAGWAQFAALGLVYTVGFGVGLLGLLYVGRLWQRRSQPRTISLGPGAMAVAETELAEPSVQAAALRSGMGIAAGIGLHNFSEGLAIGQGGQLALAGLLIVGFGLHNMTEGFGIVGPLAAARVRASWGWLGLAGLIGGGPDLPGHPGGDPRYLHLAVRGLPGPGRRLPAVCHRRAAAHRPPALLEVTLWGLLAGFLLGLATELILEVAGG